MFKKIYRFYLRILSNIVYLRNVIVSFFYYKHLIFAGFKLLVSCIETGKLELLAMASAKLHTLVHSRQSSSCNEVCYLLHRLHNIVTNSING